MMTITQEVRKETLDSPTLAHQIVDIVEEKQASDILLLDVTEQTSIASYFIIATIDNERQAKAIEDELFEKLRVEQNIRPLHIHGTGAGSGGWVLLDYGDVVVHLLTPERRIYYNLEELWSKANVVLKVL
ncbi:MAG: ribosome silencing factor [Caldilineaceae bacterium]